MSDTVLTEREKLHAAFRPRRARAVAWVIGSVELVVFVVVALIMPGTGPVAFQWYDRTGVILVGLAIAWFVSRFALLSAVPDEKGLRVRNMLYGRDLEWAQVIAVRMGNGDPWVTLDLSDGDVLAVMAIQRADGELGTREASRLATLVALHSQ